MDSKDVELIDKFVDIIKDINEIGMSQDMGGYSNMNSYANGNSYGYGRYARGNSYGRNYGRSYGQGSYGNNNGYSRGGSKEVVLDQLTEVMNMTDDEKDRKAIERLVSQMESRM